MTQNDVDVDALFDNHSRENLNSHDYKLMTRYDFKKAITEALAGRWAKDEDVRDAYLLGLHQQLSPDIICPTADQVVAQFKSERGIK